MAINIVEVGPRDGLQNESGTVPLDAKVAFIEALADAGLTDIEAGAFVHPRWVPQMADSEEVLRRLPPRPGVVYSALVPNLKGLERAQAVGVKRIAVFTAASESFTRRNINMSIDESIQTFSAVAKAALAAGMSVRGYVSTVFVCPFEGDIDKAAVLRVTEALLEMGCDQVSLGDTIGAASPREIERTVGHLLQTIPASRLALHCHDTYGTALANVCAGLNLGLTTFDASAGGLGGCPYAPGAAGNLATEDLVYLLQRMGLECSVDIEKLYRASSLMSHALGRPLPGRNWQRLHRT